MSGQHAIANPFLEMPKANGLNTLNKGKNVGNFQKSDVKITGLEEVVQFIKANPTIKPVTPKKRALSVNGRVIQDQMKYYLANKSVSSSQAKEALVSPLNYQLARNMPELKKKTPAFDLGTFAHMAFLQPLLFNKVAVEPKANRASKEGLLKLLNWHASLDGFMIGVARTRHWDQLDFDTLKGLLKSQEEESKLVIVKEDHKIIIDLIKRHYYSYSGGIIPRLLKGALPEVSIYGKDEGTGLKVKIRPDALQFEENIGRNAIISFKTTSAKTVDKFIYDTAKYKYELSEGMYQDVASDVTGRNFDVTIMIMLQTEPPYLPAVFIWSDEDIEAGKYKYHSALETIKQCYDNKSFPGNEVLAESGNLGIIELKQPDWNKRELPPMDIGQ